MICDWGLSGSGCYTRGEKEGIQSLRDSMCGILRWMMEFFFLNVSV